MQPNKRSRPKQPFTRTRQSCNRTSRNRQQEVRGSHTHRQGEEQRKPEPGVLAAADEQEQAEHDRPNTGRRDDPHRQAHEQRPDRAAASVAGPGHQSGRRTQLVDTKAAKSQHDHQARDGNDDDRVLQRGAEYTTRERRRHTKGRKRQPNPEHVQDRQPSHFTSTGRLATEVRDGHRNQRIDTGSQVETEAE